MMEKPSLQPEDGKWVEVKPAVEKGNSKGGSDGTAKGKGGPKGSGMKGGIGALHTTHSTSCPSEGFP